MNLLVFLLPVLVAVSLVYYPPFWVNVFMLVDFYTPWKIFDSKLFEAYHTFITDRLPVKDEIPLPEISVDEATFDLVLEKSHGFTFPLVIRQLMGNTSAVQKWGNHDYWIDNYGDEEVLCGLPGEDPIDGDCTVKGFFEAWKKGKPFYISGASTIFERHPELHEMIDNEKIRSLEPGTRTNSQVFIGLPGMGSDIHSAIGVNMFRQVAGQKQWWFVPPSETCYLWPAINVNGFSAHTKTKIGKTGQPSPWWNKLTRYTTTLNPGDVLINPPWFWHGIKNLGEPNTLVIGSPTRYGNNVKSPAFKTNLMLTLNAYAMFIKRYGFAFLKPGFKPNLQGDIGKNRVVRAKEMEESAQDNAPAAQELHPFDEAD